MENEAWNIAENWSGAIHRYPQKKVEMHHLFNMVAGTSSGSMVAAGLSYAAKTQNGGSLTDHQENPTPLIMQMFTKDYMNFFVKHSESLCLQIIFWVLIVLAFAAFGYSRGKKRYDARFQKKAFRNLFYVISNYKRLAKGQHEKHHYLKLEHTPYSNVKPSTEPLLDGKDHKHYYDWLDHKEKYFLQV